LTAQGEVEQRQILAALDVLGEAGYEKLHEETGLSRSTVQRRLEDLGDRVVRIGAGKKGNPFLFSARALTGQKETGASEKPLPGDRDFLAFIATAHKAGHVTTSEALERERHHDLVLRRRKVKSGG
jgi:DNA-binding Lrp family transcriptional regulator